MSLVLIPVKIIARRANGTAVAGATVRAVLTVAETDDGLVVPDAVTGVTNGSGELTLNLWPNARGINGSQYRVEIQASALFFSGLVTIPDAPSTSWPVALETLINQPPYPTRTVAELAQAKAQEFMVLAKGYHDETAIFKAAADDDAAAALGANSGAQSAFASAQAIAAALPTNLGRIFSTYAELSAVSGLSNGTPGEVTNDAGTHTDPVVGGTVANQGRYQYSVSPAGWKRVGNNDVTNLNAAAKVLADEVEMKVSDGTIPLIVPTDEGDPALAFDPTEETLFGSAIDNLGQRPYEPSREFASRLAKGSTVFTNGQGYHHVPVVVSQSNGGGSGDGDPVVSSTQPYFNVTFIGGLRADGTSGSWDSTKPLIEEVPSGSANSETVISGATEYINRYLAIKHGITPDKFLMFGAVAAQGATVLSGLDKPSTVYQLGLDQMSNAKLRAAAAGKSFCAPAGFMLQGESDFFPTPTGRSVYGGLFQQVATDLNTDVKVITGLPDDFYLIAAQLSYGASATLANNIALAQMDAARANPLIKLSHPTYFLGHDADDTHRDVLQRKLEGAVMGRAWVQIVYEQREPDVLKPLAAFYDGTYIYVRFKVPRYPMVLDINSLQKVTDYGLKVLDDTGTLALSEHRIVRGDTFVVRPNRALGANPRYRLGIDYLAWNLGSSGAGIFSGAMTNIRDSSGYLGDTLNQITITYLGVTKTYRMPHWCLHDEGAITKLAS